MPVYLLQLPGMGLFYGGLGFNRGCYGPLSEASLFRTLGEAEAELRKANTDRTHGVTPVIMVLEIAG